MFRPLVITILLFVAMAAAPGCSNHKQPAAHSAHSVAAPR
jgi:hypothetical protein